MAITRVLDTSEALPCLTTASTLSTSRAAETVYAPKKRSLQADAELTRSEKNTERLRRKRAKRAENHKFQAALKVKAKTNTRLGDRLKREEALRVLERSSNAKVDKSAYKKYKPFKMPERLPGKKECGFAKRTRK